MAYKKNAVEVVAVAKPVEFKPVESKPTITWLGEDDLHANGEGPASTVWRGITFTKGEPVEAFLPWMVEKAKGNRFFKVKD